MGGERPLRYVDVDDAELAEYPALAEAVGGGERIPLVLVGDEVKSPVRASASTGSRNSCGRWAWSPSRPRPQREGAERHGLL